MFKCDKKEAIEISFKNIVECLYDMYNIDIDELEEEDRNALIEYINEFIEKYTYFEFLGENYCPIIKGSVLYRILNDEIEEYFIEDSIEKDVGNIYYY